MIDKIVDILHSFGKLKWTGVLTLKIVFSDGGIRSCEKLTEERLK